MARNSAGEVVSEQAVGVKVRVLLNAENGSPVYTETHAATSNAFGLINLTIGNGSTSDDFSAIDFSSGLYFLEISMDLEGGTNYQLMGTSQLLSVPYAKYADKAGNVFSGSYNDLADVPSNMDTDATDDFDGSYSSLTGAPTHLSDFTNDLVITDTTLDEAEVDAFVDNNGYLKTETQNLADVAANGNQVNSQIKNLTDPTDEQDAATKAYVDALRMLVYNVAPAPELLDAGITLEEILVAGVAPTELLNDNIPVSDLLAAGVGVDTLLKSGVTAQELLDAGVHADTVLYAGAIVPGYLSDIDANSYSAVKIGDQIWMAENLMVQKEPDGSPISNVTNSTTWNGFSTSSKALCYYGNQSANKVIYGVLYTWAAAMNGATSGNDPIQGICPDGWHLPSFSEWSSINSFLGGGGITGGKLKESGTDHWQVPNTGATNESGFTALPGGIRLDNGSFSNLNLKGVFWTTNDFNTSTSYAVNLSYNTDDFRIDPYSMTSGVSVRCVKD